MAHSKAQKRTIDFGKQIVKELGLDSRVDTLSRWMAHYLAEKISLFEESSGEEKKLAEQECFDTILKIWKRRRDLPSGSRPFEDFEPLLNLVSKIGSDNLDTPLFYRPDLGVNKPEIKSINTKKIEGEDWLLIASQIDRTARVWLRHALKEFANSVKMDNTDDWLNNSVGLSDNDDAKIIRIIFDKSDDYDDPKFHEKFRKEKLEQRIIELEKFTAINEVLLKSFRSQLSALGE